MPCVTIPEFSCGSRYSTGGSSRRVRSNGPTNVLLLDVMDVGRRGTSMKDGSEVKCISGFSPLAEWLFSTRSTWSAARLLVTIPW